MAAGLAALLMGLAAIVAWSGRAPALRRSTVLRPLAAARPEVAAGLLAAAGGVVAGALLLSVLAI